MFAYRTWVYTGHVGSPYRTETNVSNGNDLQFLRNNDVRIIWFEVLSNMSCDLQFLRSNAG